MTISNDAVTERLNAALSFARQAGRLTLDYFQQDNFEVERKSDNSPVTVADRQAEMLLREKITEQFPNDSIIGEEFDNVEGDSGYCWILDPIDGTKSFISGVPIYATLVGIEYDPSVSKDGSDQAEKKSVVGIIYIPGLDECVYAATGQGAWHTKGDSEPRAAKVSSRKLTDGLFVTTQIDSFLERGGDGAYRELEKAAYITRTWGDAYGYLLIATGRAEVMIDPEMNVWDAAAIHPIMEETGGTFTDWQGKATIHSGEGVGTNGQVLDDVLEITRRYPRRNS